MDDVELTKEEATKYIDELDKDWIDDYWETEYKPRPDGSEKKGFIKESSMVQNDRGLEAYII